MQNGRGSIHDIETPGKEIYLGISRSIYPEWDGWNIIDCRKNGSINRCVLNFYKSFWDSFNGDTLLSQESATDLFIKAIDRGDHSMVVEGEQQCGYWN